MRSVVFDYGNFEFYRQSFWLSPLASLSFTPELRFSHHHLYNTLKSIDVPFNFKTAEEYGSSGSPYKKAEGTSESLR